MAVGVYVFAMTLPEILAMPDHTESDPVKINPEWENLSSYDVSIRPFPWIDMERETIESPISNKLFLKKVETGKIERVRYVVQDRSVKLYGYEPELADNISARWDLYSTELVPEKKLEGRAKFTNPRQTEEGDEIVFTEISFAVALKKIFFLAIMALTIFSTIYLIYKMVIVAKDKEYETREEEK